MTDKLSPAERDALIFDRIDTPLTQRADALLRRNKFTCQPHQIVSCPSDAEWTEALILILRLKTALAKRSGTLARWLLEDGPR